MDTAVRVWLSISSTRIVTSSSSGRPIGMRWYRLLAPCVASDGEAVTRPNTSHAYGRDLGRAAVV